MHLFPGKGRQAIPAEGLYFSAEILEKSVRIDYNIYHMAG